VSTRLVVIRHGETEWNRAGRVQGHGDSPLTAEGLAQAQAVGRRLAGEAFDLLLSSDLGRALQTASAIAAFTGHPVQADARLRERSYGVAEGLTRDEMAERLPGLHPMLWHTNPDHPVPGGESRRAFHERVGAAFEALAREHAGTRVLIVCHGGVLANLYRHATGVGLAETDPIPIPNAGYNALRKLESDWHVEVWADTAHLPPGPVPVAR
jgi:probable phosphoglycerate mutase